MTKNRRHDIVKPSKYKTSICTFFRREEGCPFGEKCAFAHGEDELRSEPKDTASLPEASAADGVTPAAAPLLTFDSTPSEHVNARAALGDEQHSDALAQQGQHDSSATTVTPAEAKRKAKKRGFDVPSTPSGNTQGLPGGGLGGSSGAARGDAPATRGRILPKRRQPLPPPPPSSLPGHGPMLPTAFGLSVAQPPLPPPRPPSFALPGDFGGLAYAGMPAVMSGMPHYIPVMGHHPFSAINDNQHAINVAPVMLSPTSYATLQPTMQLPPPPPPPPPPVPALSSSAPSGVTGPASGAAVANALPSGDAKRRQRQPLRPVVNSTTMTHSTGRHPTNAFAMVSDEVATPPYVYGLMAAAGVLLNSSSAPASNARASSGMNYPPSDPPCVAAFGGFAATPSLHPSTGPMPDSSDSGVRNSRRTPPTTVSSNAPAAQLPPPNFVTAAPAPTTAVQHRLNSASNCQSGSASSTVIGDSLWGSTERTVHPLTPSLSSRTDVATSFTDRCGSSAEDYSAILSSLGIGGSSYTTIPLNRFICERGTTSNEDDVSVEGDFDWTAAVERWLSTAREDGVGDRATTASAENPPTVGAMAVPTDVSSTASTPEASTTTAKRLAAVATTYHPQGGRSVLAALNGNPVLMDVELKNKASSTSSPATEARRRPAAAVCQVSRAAGGIASQAPRRAPVMKNQFKSSCAAEADSGAVLLYCAEKNTFVYIASGSSGTAVAMTPGKRRGQALTAATASSAAPSQRAVKSPVAAVRAWQALAQSLDNPSTAGHHDILGVHVRFVPGRRKRSVLEEVPDEEAEYCI
ncbi:putative Zinc finger C-x8-C-x5-C-x3-H type (and similar) [Leishmania utingensis]|uniref:Zinc finger C-x8-C-x5-C-x3-H type (And similar) n=1 Tax=Leishmania utingensis TaxID=653362 RepID=A0AAW3AQ93_9TRYP